MAEVINGILIREVETKNIMTKSSLPVGGYSVNPYVPLKTREPRMPMSRQDCMIPKLRTLREGVEW